jgi:hypothetical protein
MGMKSAEGVEAVIAVSLDSLEMSFTYRMSHRDAESSNLIFVPRTGQRL